MNDLKQTNYHSIQKNSVFVTLQKYSEKYPAPDSSNIKNRWRRSKKKI